MSSAHLASVAEQTSHEERMFALVHSAHDKNWQLVGEEIATHTNPFSSQQEHGNMISPDDSISDTN